MRRSLCKLAFRATLQITIMISSTGISANDYMEYEDVDSEQITYETRIQKNEHRAYQDPNFHKESYQGEQVTEEVTAY